MEENKNLNANEEMPESIWADGVPEHIDDKDRINQEELLSMSVDFVCKKILIEKGFKIDMGFPRRDFPNIVCKRDGKKYSIVVTPSIMPDFVALTDDFRLKVVEIAKQINAIPLFAPVGYKSIDAERAKAKLLLKGDVFNTSFVGFIVLTDQETQELLPSKNEIFIP